MKDHSVVGIIFSQNRKKVLLIKRRDVPVWVLPGGGIESEESLEDAMIREMLEETGYSVRIEKKVGYYLPINRLTKKSHLFECSIVKGQPKIGKETAQIAYFEIQKLPKLLPPPYKEWILDAHKNLPHLIEKKLLSVTYMQLIKNLILHPVLVIRFLLARMGFQINS